jgi:hypothetical protein
LTFKLKQSSEVSLKIVKYNGKKSSPTLTSCGHAGPGRSAEMKDPGLGVNDFGALKRLAPEVS